MVSLRERKSRPSYVTMAGFEDLSSGSRSKSGSAEPTPGEPSAGFAEGDGDRADDVSGDESSASISSGESSEFRPDEVDTGNPKVKGKEKGKGNAKAPSSADGVSPHSSDDEDSDMVVDEAIDEDDRDVIASTLPTGSTSASRKRAIGRTVLEVPKPQVPPYAKRSSGKIEHPTESGQLPSAYRDIIKVSSNHLTKNPETRPAVRSSKEPEKYRPFGIEGITSGPTTPFGTRLISDPRADGQIKWVWEDDDIDNRRNARRMRTWRLEGYIPLQAPWQVWEGEGYWKGMWDPTNTAVTAENVDKKGKGKAKEKAVDHRGWRLREDTSLGLEGVGRYTLDQMEFLSKQQAEAYLPTGRTLACHIGPHSSQSPTPFAPLSSRPIRASNPDKDGFLFSAGGPIWGLDFCPSPSSSRTQFLAVSTVSHLEDKPVIGERCATDLKGSVQIWSFTPKASEGTSTDEPEEMICEIVLCLEGGGGLDVKWMPVGARDELSDDSMNPASIPKLGILAVAQRDGTVALYSVPHPRALIDIPGVGHEDGDGTLYLKLSEPLLRLEVPDATCTCVEWMTGERLAVGLSNGHGVVWDVGDAFRSGQKDVLPMAYFPVALAAISSIAVARYPPGDPEGEPDYAGDPSYLVFGSYDGMFVMVDVREPGHVIELNRQRTPATALAWAHQLAAPIYADVDHTLIMHKVFGTNKHRTAALSAHRGPVWSIATSDYHTMALSGSSDGSAIITNFQNGYYRKRKVQPLMYHRVCEMDYDQHTQQWRMLDDFLPESMSLLHAGDRSSAKSQKIAANDPALILTALWGTEVGVHRVTWHNTGGTRHAGWAAIGTASGIGRVEWMAGRFLGGKVPSGV